MTRLVHRRAAAEQADQRRLHSERRRHPDRGRELPRRQRRELIRLPAHGCLGG